MYPKCHQIKMLSPFHSNTDHSMKRCTRVSTLPLPPALQASTLHPLAKQTFAQTTEKIFSFSGRCKLKGCWLEAANSNTISKRRVKTGNDTQQVSTPILISRANYIFLNLPDSSQNNLLVQKFRYLSFTT